MFSWIGPLVGVGSDRPAFRSSFDASAKSDRGFSPGEGLKMPICPLSWPHSQINSWQFYLPTESHRQVSCESSGSACKAVYMAL